MRSEIVATGRKKRQGTVLTTGGRRFVGVPQVLILESVVITELQKEDSRKTSQRTVTSRITQRGTLKPAGTGFGNLQPNYDVKRNRFPVATRDLRPGSQSLCAVCNPLRPAMTAT
jgi:hypothetical protein